MQDARREALVQILLELEQLAEKVEVGRDDGALALDELVGVAHGHLGVLEEVGDGDGGGARHPRVAVDQHAGSLLPGFVCSHTQTHT